MTEYAYHCLIAPSSTVAGELAVSVTGPCDYYGPGTEWVIVAAEDGGVHLLDDRDGSDVAEDYAIYPTVQDALAAGMVELNRQQEDGPDDNGNVRRQSTVTLRLPHRGDPDEATLGVCRDCGPDHWVIDGMCDECDTCAMGVEDRNYSPCALRQLADSRAEL